MGSLEQKLGQCKGPLQAYGGYRVSENILAKDGIEFLVTRGAPPAVAALEQILNEVFNLYKPRCRSHFSEALH